MNMLVKDFDYDLPPELIAQHPLPGREDSRMMVVHRATGEIDHSQFRSFPDYMSNGDVIVLNDTRVIPAKVYGMKKSADEHLRGHGVATKHPIREKPKPGDSRPDAPSLEGPEASVKVEFLFLKEVQPRIWEVLCRPAKKVAAGDRIYFSPGFEAEVIGRRELGKRILRFKHPEVLQLLDKVGFAPLPPYIKRGLNRAAMRPRDLERYQTVFARKSGAIAAPTAGMHFTKRILAELKKKGARLQTITLDVGLATFQPVRVERVEEHRMLDEPYEISPAAARTIATAKKEGRPVLAVGTTVVRALESSSDRAARLKQIDSDITPLCPEEDPRDAGADKIKKRTDGENIEGSEGKIKSKHSADDEIMPAVISGSGTTSLFIHPGYEFKVVDRLLTNFHLPRSTLLMLVSAFAGRDIILRAYEEAVLKRYRFFSYGDCMLII